MNPIVRSTFLVVPVLCATLQAQSFQFDTPCVAGSTVGATGTHPTRLYFSGTVVVPQTGSYSLNWGIGAASSLVCGGSPLMTTATYYSARVYLAGEELLDVQFSPATSLQPGLNFPAQAINLSQGQATLTFELLGNYSVPSFNLHSASLVGTATRTGPVTAPPPVCQTNLGSGGPGNGFAWMCGDGLGPGQTSAYRAIGLVPGAPVLVGISLPGFANVPFGGGTLVSAQGLLFAELLVVDSLGSIDIVYPGLAVAGDLVFQALSLDAGQPGGVAITNALSATFG